MPVCGNVVAYVVTNGQGKRFTFARPLDLPSFADTIEEQKVRGYGYVSKFCEADASCSPATDIQIPTTVAMPIKHLESVSHSPFLHPVRARNHNTYFSIFHQRTSKSGSTFKRSLSTSSQTPAWESMPPTTSSPCTTPHHRANRSSRPQAGSRSV